jgi:uncharacterized protein YkwD
VTRYVGELRWRFVGDAQLAQSFIPRARKVVGLLHETSPGIPTNRVTREVAEGVTVTVWQWMSQITAEIDVRVLEEKRAEKGTPNAVWIPKGFVVYPVSDDAPQGWGVPIIHRAKNNDGEDIGPWDKENLAPGLDTERWTPGGAWGQVLLSKIPNAGYPQGRNDRQLVAAPLLYHDEYGPRIEKYLEPPAGDSYAAYRVELSDYDGEEKQRECFDLTNDLRVAVGRDPLVPPPKWRFNSAQASAETMHDAMVMGHFSEHYWPTWAKPADRFCRDGAIHTSYGLPNNANVNLWENAAAQTFGSLDVIGHDPHGVPIYSVSAPGPAFTAAEAVDLWEHSPGHYAHMVNVRFDADTGRRGTFFAGFSENYATQHFERADRWIGCGNRSWRSSHPEIPQLTWFGFPAINLAFETMTLVSQPSAWPPTPPGATFPYALDFTLDNAFLGADALGCMPYMTHSWDGVFWSPEADEALRSEEMQRFVFARGRAFAQAPDNGLVWAAAMQKIPPDVPGEPATYRLVILAHHAADQPSAASDQALLKQNGPTAKLRVWWADVLEQALLPTRPQRMIYGVYGDEDDGWPWDELNLPWSWRGGDLVDVGTSDGIKRDLLKYGSQWVFNHAGTKAICARDKGDAAEYAARLVPDATELYTTVRGLSPVALELSFSTSMAPSLSVFSLPACATEQTNVCAGMSYYTNYFVGNLLAAGYDENDNRKYAFIFSASFQPFMYTPERRPNYRWFGFSTDYDWLPTCALTNPYLTLFDSTTRSAVGTPLHESTNFMANYPLVLDVEDEVVVVSSRPPRMMENYYGHDPDYGGDIYNTVPNPDMPMCWKNAIGDFSIVVRVWRNGVLLGTQEYPHTDYVLPANDMALFTYNITPPGPGGSSYLRVVNTVAQICQDVMPTYARSGADWMVNYTLTPQPWAWYVDMDFDISTVGFDPAVESCLPSIARRRYMFLPDGMNWGYNNPNREACRGGHSYSSFATHEELVEMTQTPGDNPRFLYVRAV